MMIFFKTGKIQLTNEREFDILTPVISEKEKN